MKRLIFYALVLNSIWEFTHCALFFDMWDWPFWKNTLYMWTAIIGDIFIVLGCWKAMKMISERTGLYQYRIIIMLLISIIVAIFLEWLAISLNLWSYNNMMPTLMIGGHAIGISPIIQISILPALSFYLSERYTNFSFLNKDNDSK